MLKKLLLLILVMPILIGCPLNKQRKLKSPCLQGNGNTSCELYPINDRWLSKYKVNS